MTELHQYPNTPSEPNLLNEPSAAVYGLPRISLIRKGLSLASLLSFFEKTGLTRLELAPVLHLSVRTLQRLEETANLSPAVSEKLLQLNDLYQLGSEALGPNPRNTTLWLKDPNEALNNEKPLDFLDTYQGIEEIKKLLGRIIHGVYS